MRWGHEKGQQREKQAIKMGKCVESNSIYSLGWSKGDRASHGGSVGFSPGWGSNPRVIRDGGAIITR